MTRYQSNDVTIFFYIYHSAVYQHLELIIFGWRVRNTWNSIKMFAKYLLLPLLPYTLRDREPITEIRKHVTSTLFAHFCVFTHFCTDFAHFFFNQNFHIFWFWALYARILIHTCFMFPLVMNLVNGTWIANMNKQKPMRCYVYCKWKSQSLYELNRARMAIRYCYPK